ncbi:MAG TPA: type IV toxin-antitoxin system AbiEi family antitoxin domain-containing protein [Solirubrobacteraceae bacterium]|nr:type IV toxin-antitoxin system AbiEi family antitoxin domain-containing protein [Solirubrobacteraceae bacterium]
MRPKLDNRPDLAIAQLAAEQWGVLSLHELLQCGVSDDGVERRVQSGHLHRIHRGVYAVGHANLPLEGRFLAATKACGPTAVLSHYSAATLWGLVDWDDRHPEVTVPGTTTRTHKGIRVHRSRTLRRADVMRRQGVWVTTPARTIRDLSSKLPYKTVRRAARHALSLKLVAPHQLPRPIAAAIAPTRSELEDAVLDLIIEHGLEPPDVNKPLHIDGRRVIPDFRWPAQRLIVEADGAKWHDNAIARQDDAERQAILEAHGERVVRVTWEQAITGRRETVARLVEAGAPKRISRRRPRQA